MSKLTLQDVETIARLARLHLTAEEKVIYQKQLSDVLTYVEQLGELDLDGIPPTAHAVAQQNVVREDVVSSSLTVEQALGNAAAVAADQFAIQAVFAHLEDDDQAGED